MFRFLYNIFLIISFIPYVIIILIRIFLNKEHKSKFKEKIFFKRVKKPSGFLFWFHASSLGELNSIFPIIDNYLRKDEKNNFLITTVTLSSYDQFKKKYKGNNRVFHQFLPYDFGLFVNYFLKSWKPDIVSFVDSEIWPNFIFSIEKKKIPLVLLNARITKKTFNRWRYLRKFSKKIFGLFSVCIASSKETEEYLKILNAKNIKYFGNLKFCSNNQDLNEFRKPKLIDIKKKKVWCAVSTHENEEMFCSEVQKNLSKSIKDTLCVIIPRHVNRTKKIFTKISKLGLKLQIKNENDIFDNSADIILINYYGAVNLFLSKIKNVFMGKSLIKKLSRVGGQNPIEAAKMGCYIFHGPYVSNFSEIYSYFGKNGFSQEINSPEELVNKLIKNFNDSNKIVNKEKLNELEIYSNSVFSKIISEYDILINENY